MRVILTLTAPDSQHLDGEQRSRPDNTWAVLEQLLSCWASEMALQDDVPPARRAARATAATAPMTMPAIAPPDSPLDLLLLQKSHKTLDHG